MAVSPLLLGIAVVLWLGAGFKAATEWDSAWAIPGALAVEMTEEGCRVNVAVA